MEDDQQFCLRWNNHQSTLVAVFDTLLENGTLVDCTLAAEGKYLNAHKVVLSACSPYFESLLSQNYDKHPIFILKDVKYQELKAMMDYMYRGEVNISQDQLGALLKAAESLQIKGLSDNRKGETETRKTVAPPPPPAKSPPPATSLPRVQGLTIEQRRREMEESREGSQSPGARKKKRIRRRSLDDLVDNHHDASNSSESHHSSQAPAQNIPTTLPAAPSKIATEVPEPIETKSEILTRHKSTTESEVPQVPIIKEKVETHSELMLEPKAEYIEEMNEDSIEDLTLDDDDISNMEQMDDQGAGPSHGNMGEGSGQGFGGWHMGNQSQDEVFLAAQEAVGAHRDSQGNVTTYKEETQRMLYGRDENSRDTRHAGITPGFPCSRENIEHVNITEQHWTPSSSDQIMSVIKTLESRNLETPVGGGGTTAFEHKLLESFTLIREQNEQILAILKKNHQILPRNVCMPHFRVNLPVSNSEEAEILEEHLKNSEDFSSLRAYLSCLGGKDLSSRTNRILRALMTDTLASTYNFYGFRCQDTKRAFVNLQMKKVVIQAVQISLPQSTVKDIEDSIKVWLKHAPERVKKQNRKK